MRDLYRRAAMVFPGVLVALAFSVSPVFGTSFTKPCGDANNEHEYLEWNADPIQGAAINHLLGKSLADCTATPESTGASFALPLNIQGTGICGAQLGFGRLHAAYGWYFTPVDNCYLSKPSGWPSPIANHDYQLIIEIDPYDCPGMQWAYLMLDNTTGTGPYVKCGSRAAAAGQKWWGGFEVYDSGSAMGGAGVDVTMYGMNVAFGTVWSQIIQTTVHKNVGVPSGWTESYWVRTATNPGSDYTTLKSHTNSH